MPYQSDKQRKFMHAKHPGIAARWDKEMKSKKKVSKAMTTSYWGVDHGEEVAKAQKKNPPPPSAGRVATGALFGWPHGAIAGKKGSKLKASGMGLGGTFAGSLIGGRVAGPRGSALGAMTGGAAATVESQRRGYLKPQKNMKGKVYKSYWGVDHAEEIAKKSYDKKHPALRSPYFNSRKQNTGYSAASSAATLGAFGAAAGLAATRGKALSSLPRAEKAKGVAALAGAGGALGGASGALSGSLLPTKNSKGAPKARKLIRAKYSAKQNYKNSKRKADNEYWGS